MEAGKVSLAWSSFLGYEKGPDGLPHIVEEEAKIVKKIYRLYLEGNTLKGIADQLTREGCKTPMDGKKWHTTTVRSILSNEKYKGDARLQKTFVKSFLTKEVCVNKGQRKQWYIQDSHDAIISPETFELVQKELERRGGSHGRFYDSPFTRKIICGICGAYYGHRVWDSNSKYRKYVWICNDKYKGGDICRVPRLMDDEIEQAFIIVANKLLNARPECVKDYEAEFLPLIGETNSLKNQLEDLTKELDSLIEQIERLVQDNAHHAQNQKNYSERFNELDSSIVEKKKEIETVKQKMSDNLIRKANVKIFLDGLYKMDSILKQFDVTAWHALVDYVIVMPDNSLIFQLRNGEEISIPLEEVQ